MPDYTEYRLLRVALPPLVKKQQEHARRIAEVKEDKSCEERLRGEIDALLVEAGLQSGDSVTCQGYEVTHYARAGSVKVHVDLLTAQLAAVGLAPDLIDDVVTNSTVVGEPSSFAKVEAAKTSKVRA